MDNKRADEIIFLLKEILNKMENLEMTAEENKEIISGINSTLESSTIINN